MRVKFCFVLAVAMIGSAALRAIARPSPSGPSFSFNVLVGSQVSKPLGAAAPSTERSSAPAFEVTESPLTNDGTPDQWLDASRHAALIRAGGVGFYAVPAEPDALLSPNAMESFRSIYGPRYHGPNYRSFDYQSIHFILLDSTVPGHKFGHLGSAEENWLANDLKHQRSETPIFVFLYHDVGVGNAITRPLDNEYDLRAMMRGHNICAIFCGEPHSPDRWKTDGVLTIAPPVGASAQIVHVTVDRALVTFEQHSAGQSSRTTEHLPLVEAMQSILQVGWNDPNNPFLARRRVAALLDPRSPSDSADGETAKMRIDDMPWLPMTQDIRDIWKRVFYPQSVPVGVHVCDVQLTTSNHEVLGGELIFEVERSHSEATRDWAINLRDGIVTTPFVEGQNVFVTSLDHGCYCLNRDTGKTRWSANLEGQSVTDPVVNGNSVYAASLKGVLYSLNKESGGQRWKYDTNGAIRASVAVAGDVVIVSSGTDVIAVSADSGKFMWRAPVGGYCAGELVSNHGVVFVHSSSGLVFAFNIETGNLIWKTMVGGEQARSAKRCRLTAADQQVYVVNSSGVLYNLNEATGAVNWHATAPAGEEPFHSTPVVLGLNVYVAGSGPNGDIYSLSAVDGSVQWVTGIGQAINGSAPVLSPDGRSLAIMGGRGAVAVLNAGNGHVAWRYSLGPGNIVSSPAFDGEHLYTTTMADDVQCINAPGVGAPPPILPRW